MENIQSKINAYKELQSVIEKYPEEFKGDYNLYSIKESLQCLEMQQRFGIPLIYYGPEQYQVKNAFNNWTHLALYGNGNCRISWPDNGEQPSNEWLYVISFPTGAYIFGDGYPENTFKAFWDELRAFSPKYCDTVNNNMYFTEENSKAVYDAFWGIFNKYKAMVADEMKEQRKKELEAELAKLNKE